MKAFRVPVILVAGGLLAAACGSTVPSGALTSLPAAEGNLNLVIWVGYAESGKTDKNFDWVTPFEAKTGCMVHTTDGVDSPNMVSLMATGQYDGVSASGDATLRMIAAGTVAPVNMALIPNYANVFAGLKGQPHNTVNGVPYGTPHGRGANLLLYNTDTFPTPPTSWDPVWDPNSPAKGKISIYNSSIYIADAAMRLMHTKPELAIKDPYQLNDAQFKAAVDLLTAQSKIVGEYWSLATDQITSFGSGAMLAGTSWQYQFNNMPAGSKVGIVKPAEGTTGWSDTWMIATHAAHPGCMYRWMDWMLSANANAQATIFFGEAPVSKAACDAAEAISPGHCATYHATDEAYFSDVKFWSTPRADCNDTDAATTCKDVNAWIQAWTTITGG